MKKTDQHIGRNDRWERSFQQLVEFKKAHGHCNVPTRSPEYKVLGYWVSNVRKFYSMGKLSTDRIIQLQKLGFNFDSYSAAWQEMYAQLLKFKQDFGHANVPNPFPENQKLAGWVKTQRTKYKRGGLSREKIGKLEKIGFIWRRHHTAWKEMYQRLVRFKDVHGHCNVPRDWPGDPRLSRWVITQRTRRKTLKKDRIKRLDEIGFGW